jgi:hypothetical protein
MVAQHSKVSYAGARTPHFVARMQPALHSLEPHTPGFQLPELSPIALLGAGGLARGRPRPRHSLPTHAGTLWCLLVPLYSDIA